MTYHANRSASDGYVFEDFSFSNYDDTLTINGPGDSDEGMHNEGKTFKGWNTAADGSGAWYANGDNAAIGQLNLHTREQYIKDLEELAGLQVAETPDYYPEETADTGSEADKLDERIRLKYTTHLYAQWEDNSPTTDTPTDEPTDEPTVTPSASSGDASESSLPDNTSPSDTGDKNMMPLWITIAGAALSVLVTVLVFRIKKKTE